MNADKALEVLRGSGRRWDLSVQSATSAHGFLYGADASSVSKSVVCENASEVLIELAKYFLWLKDPD